MSLIPTPFPVAAAVAVLSVFAGQGAFATDGDLPPGAEVQAGDGIVVSVPSGQSVTLQDVILNVPGTDGIAARFRFVAPAIAPGGGIDMATASTDMQTLCDSFALPRVKDNTPLPQQIIISLSDRPLPFGQSSPEAVQFFESYRIEDGSCQWEMF